MKREIAVAVQKTSDFERQISPRTRLISCCTFTGFHRLPRCLFGLFSCIQPLLSGIKSCDGCCDPSASLLRCLCDPRRGGRSRRCVLGALERRCHLRRLCDGRRRGRSRNRFSCDQPLRSFSSLKLRHQRGKNAPACVIFKHRHHCRDAFFCV